MKVGPSLRSTRVTQSYDLGFAETYKMEYRWDPQTGEVEVWCILYSIDNSNIYDGMRVDVIHPEVMKPHGGMYMDMQYYAMEENFISWAMDYHKKKYAVPKNNKQHPMEFVTGREIYEPF